MTAAVTAVVLAAVSLGAQGYARAWVYPEHRDITRLAVGALDPGRRALLDRLWAEARAGREARLCASAAAEDAGAPACIDWAAWAAIAGDHSCSPADMLAIALDSPWILDVAAVGARLAQQLAGQRENANILRGSDVQLQRADPMYASRAGNNAAHFLLARPSPQTSSAEYLALALYAGSELNAVGVYVHFHAAALRGAARLAGGGAAPGERDAAARAVLADEAFALHFLEDAFAGGHIAGSWGVSAMRKGTHDYYNEHGIEARSWNGEAWVAKGDAHMGAGEAQRAARAVRASLQQVLDAAAGARAPGPPGGGRDGGDASDASARGELDVCRARAMLDLHASGDTVALAAAVLGGLPIPALAEGAGSMPRFRAELGPFIGISAAAQVGWLDGGFERTQTTDGADGDLEVGLRLGLGLEGVVDDAGDGLVFLDVGLRVDTPSSMAFTQSEALAETGAITAAIPGRTGIDVRLRVPFFLLPGDLLLGALLVAPFSRSAYARMAITAANGGLLPWQLGFTTRAGRFQLVFGRELGFVLYGYANGGDRLLMPPAAPGGAVRLIALRSLRFDFPVLEYRPFRSFSLDQTSALAIQLFVGMEVPSSAKLISPADAPQPELQNVYTAGVRVGFDWRRY